MDLVERKEEPTSKKRTDSQSTPTKWVITRIALACNITREGRTYWKGSEYDVESIHGSKILVRTEDSTLLLDRHEYRVKGRRRGDNGK